jgi:hypothetical protein
MYKRIIIAFLLLYTTKAFCADHKYYFYNPDLDYGSESTFNPFSLFINGSFDILRNGGHSKDIFNQPYRNGIKNVINNILNPFDNIEKYGYKNFFIREIINLKAVTTQSQFLPNFGLHLIGNGMQYQKLAEWYEYNAFPYPHLLSIITTVSYQLINETVENGNYLGPNVDPISDMLIFNPLGILLFSSEVGQRFFTTKIPIYDWSMNPYYNPTYRSIENAGQQYATKIKFKTDAKTALFGYWGVVSTFGISRKLNETDAMSFSVGAVVNKLKSNNEDIARYMTPDIDYAAALFFDRNNSLLGSLVISGPKSFNVRLEIFPGVIGYNNFKPGFYIGAGQIDRFQMGISFPNFPFGIMGKINS